MKKLLLNKYIRTPLILCLFFLAAGILSESYVLHGGIRKKDISSFTHTFQHKQAKIDRLIDNAISKLEKLPDDLDQPLFDILKENNELFEHKELSIVVTRLGEAVYWSDHVVGFMDEIKSAQEGLVLLPNGWFVLTRRSVGPYVVHGLVLIKYGYKIENNYLRNRFAKGFHIPNDFKVLFYPSQDSYAIFDVHQKFQFSIKSSGAWPCIYTDLYYPATFYLLALLFFFMLIYRGNTHYLHRYSEFRLLIILVLLIGFYALMNYLQLPKSVYMLNLFTPKQFAYSSFWSSLGALLVFSGLMFFWSINFFRSFNLPATIKQNKLKRRFIMILCLVLIGGLFVFVRYMMYILIMNSSISFAIYQIEEINFSSVLGFLSIGFLFFAFLLISLRVVQVFRKHTSGIEFFIILGLLTLMLSGFFQFLSPNGEFRVSIFYFLIVGTSYVINRKGIFTHRLSVIVLYVFIFTVFTLVNLISFVEKHENKLQELMVINLSQEHDPTAEEYLHDMDVKIVTDTFLLHNIKPPYNEISDYIARRYFGGYFREYELQITICDESDSLVLQPQNEKMACYPFFDEVYEKKGIEVPDLHFRYIENMNGRITYLGRFDLEYNNIKRRLYIELNSKLLSEGTGFPELLLPQHSIENRIRNHFSFAKYNEGELVDRGGDFLYALTANAYKLSDKELTFQSWDGYQHCIYKRGHSSSIIVSRPNADVYDYVISFPYLFVFFFLLASLIQYATNPYLRFTISHKSLRIRIQIAIVGVVLFTLLIIGGGTIYFNIMQYRANHQQDLVDKINSISIEIDLLMNQMDGFENMNMEYMNSELVRISDIFWTDINLYNLKGELQATSRPEVFDKGLISPRMDNTAIHFLNMYHPTRFLHREHVGKMEYLSAYVPLIDRLDRNIGYINLPYFTHERQFRQQITTFILAFINIYVFLLMASILMAYYISTRITEPLKLIRENLSRMQLGKNTQPIIYKSEDEIGLLVSEYNNKVAELELSADLLARNEREMAWREMAKQIAHEIKNPLTPMKLNIQFLQRTDKSDQKNYEELVNRVSATLIEQIDNLSAIATEFSNFAKMPTAHNEQFNLAERLHETVELFANTGQFELITDFSIRDNLMVHADKEQFSRAIINLIKNARQAIPENRNGKVIVQLKKEKRSVVIAIIDNGKGIDESLHDSIFVPNFTTKTSGAGLGLAITKNIVENFKGEIWYDSEVGVGTTFFIRIPLV